MTSNDQEENRLQEINEDLIPQVLITLKEEFPRSIHIYYFIWMQLEWKKKNAPSGIKVYCCNGNPNGGVFVAVSIIDKTQSYRIMVHSSDKNQMKLKSLLKTLPVDWSKRPLFEAVFEEDIPIIEELIKSNGLKSLYEGIFNQVWLPPHMYDKLNVNPPDDTYLDRLTEDHAKIVNETWKYGTADTEIIVKNTICVNFGIGLFRKSDSKLLAWNTMQHFAGLGMLFTDIDERGKGYGRLVTAALAEELIALNIIPFAAIRDNNEPSMAVYTRTGFVISDRVTWIIATGNPE